jgi:hypothetical protein
MRRLTLTIRYLQVLALLIYTFVVLGVAGPWLFDLHDNVALWITVFLCASVPLVWLWFVLSIRKSKRNQKVLR